MLKRVAQRLRHCECGAVLVEYGIAVALAIAAGSVGLIVELGGMINSQIKAVSALM